MKNRILAILALIPAFAFTTHAVANSWTNSASGKWEAGGNWSAGAPNFAQTSLLITNAGTKTVTIDATTAGSFPGTLTNLMDLTVSAPSGSFSTLYLNNAGFVTPLTVADVLEIDANGALTVNQSVVQVLNQLNIGSASGPAALTITNGGIVYGSTSFLGLSSTSSGNSALVMGPGSVWSNSANLDVGHSGSGNTLVISNQGVVYNRNCNVGDASSSSSNTVLVTGNGSIWNNSGDLELGFSGAANTLVISNQGIVYNNYADLGVVSSSSNNTVLVTGSGSVWSNSFDVNIGDGSTSNQLIIADGGAMFCGEADIGQFRDSNSALVTGPGSVWRCSGDTYGLVVGDSDYNQLIVSNGGAAYAPSGYVGLFSFNNITVVTGSGSVWNAGAQLVVGYDGASNSLVISDQGVAIASNVVIGFFDYDGSPTSNNVIQVAGGSLFATDATSDGQLVIGQGGGAAALILNSGSVTADQLMSTNGVGSIFTFNGGWLGSSSTFVNNAQTFVVGDGTDAATFHINGGVHSFANNLEISNRGVLSGCGTINGNVTIDPGGLVLADCGGSLTFTGIVTNNGTMKAINGSVLEGYSPVVNNGTIDIANGSTNFHGGFVNNGTVITGAAPVPFQITSIARQGNDIRITWQTPPGSTNALHAANGAAGGSYNTNNFAAIFTVTNTVGTTTNYLDIGGATNTPSRFYRVRLVP